MIRVATHYILGIKPLLQKELAKHYFVHIVGRECFRMEQEGLLSERSQERRLSPRKRNVQFMMRTGYS